MEPEGPLGPLDSEFFFFFFSQGMAYTQRELSANGTDFLPLLVLACRGRLLVIALRNTRELPESITSTGAKILVTFLAFSTILVWFLSLRAKGLHFLCAFFTTSSCEAPHMLEPF